jgi:hypothetical protein
MSGKASSRATLGSSLRSFKTRVLGTGSPSPATREIWSALLVSRRKQSRPFQTGTPRPSRWRRYWRV